MPLDLFKFCVDGAKVSTISFLGCAKDEVQEDNDNDLAADIVSKFHNIITIVMKALNAILQVSFEFSGWQTEERVVVDACNLQLD
mmetsp:Transcript_25141/g.35215  ORF Transcript_25141/g.35215 Transcript_25141/m.35215 type:complete len:85 (-) Transcript_25141:286-540(-)